MSFPEDFRTRMAQQLGPQWASFEDAHQHPPPVSIRINPNKRKEPGDIPVPWAKDGFYLRERPSFTLDPSFHGGSYYVQEASSMFLEQAFRHVTDSAHSINVLDLCAAPGGKSTHLLSLLNNKSLLVSNEVIRSRASILAENIQKWGSDNVIVTNSDPQKFKSITGFFDVILIDAPCSGEGMFRKDPESINAWSAENVRHCEKRQQRILMDLWPALKEGGYLIYATCTYNTLENEENLNWLSDNNDVEFVKLQLQPSWNIEEVFDRDVIGYRFYPHRVNGEGLFMAVVRKKSGEREMRVKQRESLTTPSKKIISQCNSWIDGASEKAFFQHHDQIRFFPGAKMPELAMLSKSLYIVNAGTLLATTKHDKLVPEHAASLSQSINKQHFETINVTQSEALQYLRKEPLSFAGIAKGFALIQYNGLPLGWVNVLDNRINNLYPPGWRIRAAGSTQDLGLRTNSDTSRPSQLESFL